jgi:hypothetical protein
MFSFVFRMFSVGRACLPAEGMEAIPRQLAEAVPPQGLRVGARVARVGEGSVTLDTGEEILARSIVVAVDGRGAARLLGGGAPAAGRGVTCLYFVAATPPVDVPLLVLNGEGRGPINNLCVPTAVAPTYGRGGASLVSVTVLGLPPEDGLESAVRGQLREWFGPSVGEWRHLRTYRIPYALPGQTPPALAAPERPVRARPGLYVCGDHMDNASIQGAMASGRRAAEAVLGDRASAAPG